MRKVLWGLGGLVVALLALYVVLYVASRGVYELPPTVEQDPSLPHVVLDGVTLHAEAFGGAHKPTVVVVHGGPGNDYRYLLGLQALSDDYRVVFYDQRGTGLSPRVPSEEHTLDNMVSDLHRVVLHYGEGAPLRIVGHSWGAMLASAYVGEHPTQVSHLVLAEPGLLTNQAAKAFLEKFKADLGWDGIKALVWLGLQSRHVEPVDSQAQDDFFFTGLARLDVPGNPTRGYFCDGRVPREALPAWRYSMTASRALMGEGLSDLDARPLNLAQGVERYTGKTLFLTGACNVTIGEAHQRAFHLPLFPDARLAVIEGAGHAMFGEKPQESLAVVRAFLEE